MLLTAMLNDQRFDASKHSSAEWAVLQASEGRKRLVLPGCGMRAVAKKSSQGTQYFAHRAADCGFAHGGETRQHLALKAAVAAQIDDVQGWRAIVEFPHPSREWIIDVLAESDDGRKRIAFEVQLSSQTPEQYFARSDRYFMDEIFPVWLVPRPLAWNRIRVPEVVTGFSKSSAVPEDVSELMELQIDQDLVSCGEALGQFIVTLLTRGCRWEMGSPERQRQQIAARVLQAERERKAAADREEEFRRGIEETNKRCTAPEKAFGEHTVRVAAGPYIWATLMECWSCKFPSLIWDAVTPLPGQRHHLETVPEIKSKVGLKRFENHPEVHAAVDRWMREVACDVMKAEIELRKSKAREATYSGFTCPVCGTLSGQFFISAVEPWRWSLISAPVKVSKKPVKQISGRTDQQAARKPKASQHQKVEKAPERNPPALGQVPNKRGITVPALPKKTWEELHSQQGVEEARKKFYGTRGRRQR